MPRYKDPRLERIYQGLLGKTPDKLLKMKIFGSIHAAFKRGYEQLSLPRYIPRGTPAHVAYMAGKKTGKRR